MEHKEKFCKNIKENKAIKIAKNNNKKTQNQANKQYSNNDCVILLSFENHTMINKTGPKLTTNYQKLSKVAK